jgi:hypothetical protein
MGTDVRLEFMEKLRLSVEAMGRRDRNMSARNAGIGEVEEGVAADVREPAEDRRVLSVDARKQTNRG